MVAQPARERRQRGVPLEQLAPLLFGGRVRLGVAVRQARFHLGQPRRQDRPPFLEGGAAQLRRPRGSERGAGRLHRSLGFGARHLGGGGAFVRLFERVLRDDRTGHAGRHSTRRRRRTRSPSGVTTTRSG